MGTWGYKPVLKQLQSNSGDEVDPANVSCVATTITQVNPPAFFIPDSDPTCLNNTSNALLPNICSRDCKPCQ